MGNIKLQADDTRIATIQFEDGAGADRAVTIPKEGGKIVVADVNGDVYLSGGTNAVLRLDGADTSSLVFADAGVSKQQIYMDDTFLVFYDITNSAERLRLTPEGKLVSPNGSAFVGTVSNAGNSSIIERGSNANGEYTKFVDGTMICTHSSNAGGDVDTANGSLYSTASVLWTFPVEFAVIPETSVSEEAGVGSCFGGLGTVPNNTIRTSWQLHRAIAVSGSAPSASLIAIGRWF